MTDPLDILRDCLLEAGDDVDAGLAAAECILSAERDSGPSGSDPLASISGLETVVHYLDESGDPTDENDAVSAVIVRCTRRSEPVYYTYGITDRADNTALSTDARGRKHKGKGEGGGQFTSDSGSDRDNSADKPAIPRGLRLAKAAAKAALSEWKAIIVGHGTRNRTRLGNLRVSYDDGSSYKVEQFTEDFDEWKERVPEKLLKSIKSIQFINKDDPSNDFNAWRYGIPGFKSAASAFVGGIQVWKPGDLSLKLLAHEAAHNFAWKKWWSPVPPRSSEYGRAQQEEPPVTKYGATMPAEDFAEACMLYVNDPEYLEQEFPLKYRAVRNLLEPAQDGPAALSIFLAQDTAQPRAQTIIDRAVRAARKMTAGARRELEAALRGDPASSGDAVLAFIDKYRSQLTDLLTSAQLAAVLEGARVVANKVPQLKKDVDELQRTTGDTPQSVIPLKEGPHQTIIRDAARLLAGRNVITRQSYDVLDAQARAKAAVVAGADSEATLAKVRDAMADNVREGADHATFRAKVLDAVGEGTFLSDAHLEMVFRTNVQTAFSDGQVTVLQNPIIRGGFPYAAYDAIHDDRARHNHLAVEDHGIDGTNVYRADDPVFQMFRPPWDYNCRCSWTPMTVRQAAEAGVPEAQEWLRTGLEPTPPARVTPPPFDLPEGFERSLADAPLSIRLSVQPMSAFGSPSFKEAPRPVLDATLQLVYPRDKSNRFISPREIARAAREPAHHDVLRDTTPAEHHGALDRAVAHLQADGAIHHPKDHPGTAVDISGSVVEPRWADYAWARDRHGDWESRNAERVDRRAAADEAVRIIRDGSKDLKSVDRLLKTAGATPADLRALARAHRSAKRKDDPLLEIEAYEDAIEAVHRRLDEDEQGDQEPPVPEEPDGDWALAIDAEGHDHKGKGPGGGQFVKKGSGGGGGDDGQRQRGGDGGGRGVGRGGPGNAGEPARRGGPVENATPRSGGQGDGGVRQDTSRSTGTQPDRGGRPGKGSGAGQGVRARTAGGATRPGLSATDQQLRKVNRRIARFANKFRNIGKEPLADWLIEFRAHMNEIGLRKARRILGEDRDDQSTERVQYKGTGYFDKEDEEEVDETNFIKEYLDRAGITLQTENTLDPKMRLVASAPLSGRSKRRISRPGDVVPVSTSIETKLQESKLLPGLESTEDLSVIVGSEVTHFTPEVLAKLDERYGKDKWIVKSYGDEAYAGFGVFFPQRVRQIQEDARAALADADKQMRKLGYTLSGRSVENTRTGDVYKLSGKGIAAIPDPKVQRLARIARTAAPSAEHTALPLSSEDSLEQNFGIRIRWDGDNAVGITDWNGIDIDFDTPAYEQFEEDDEYGAVVDAVDRAVAWEGERGKSAFMAQPAFEAVGVTEADRAIGATWETSTEGRVHVVARGGVASVVQYATLAGREDSVPVVFADKEVQAMERAAQEAVNALPPEERTNHVYAPDVMKTKDGWRVVELNSSVETGSSAWLEKNPLVIDAYVSHIVGRDPSHVTFMRNLLRDRMRRGVATEYTARASSIPKHGSPARPAVRQPPSMPRYGAKAGKRPRTPAARS